MQLVEPGEAFRAEDGAAQDGRVGNSKRTTARGRRRGLHFVYRGMV